MTLRAIWLGGIAPALLLGGCTMADGYGGTPNAGYGVVPKPGSSASEGEWQQARYYQPLDEADSLATAIGASPPDFGFRYAGSDGWGWESEAGERLLMENRGADSIQYFFRPGANAPYVIRAGARTYAFEGSGLLAVFDGDGRLLGYGDDQGAEAEADRMFLRGRDMWRAASQPEDDARGWNDSWANSWVASYGLSYSVGGWGNGWWRSQPGWHSYYGRNDYYLRERQLRANRADVFRRWIREGRRGAPPHMVRPDRPGGVITRPRPNWQRPVQPEGTTARPEGVRPNWQRPNRPDGASRPEGARPNWQRPEGQRPGGQRPEGQRPDRPNWGQGGRGPGRPQGAEGQRPADAARPSRPQPAPRVQRSSESPPAIRNPRDGGRRPDDR